MNCKDRADKAQLAIECGGYFPDKDVGTSVVDLIADIMHLCQENDINFDEGVRIARGHFNEEQRDC